MLTQSFKIIKMFLYSSIDRKSKIQPVTEKFNILAGN